MAQKFSNVSEVPLALAVFLASDNYDYNNEENVISATTLLKPLRQIILSARVPQSDHATPLVDMVKNRIGAAIHDAIENAWTKNKDRSLEALGYPKRVRDLIKVNPTPEEMTGDTIPVYMEQRLSKKMGKWTVSGKFDFIGDGMVQDFKSTSVFTYTNQTNGTKYIQQGSIYRWLDPKKITEDRMQIHYIFTDWRQNMARNDPNYPQKPTVTQSFNLMTYQETEMYIRRKLEMIEKYWDAPEPEIPHCSDEELWRSEPKFKYYGNPNKMLRSTKNFDTASEAYSFMAEKGSVGVVVEVPGQVQACKYCSAYSVCSQKDLLIENGQLVL